MCIVVDTNTLAPVFSEKCAKHEEFGPVKEWIDKGKGFLVFGGSRYKRELGKTYRYLRLVRRMKDNGQAVAIRDDLVDASEARLIEATRRTDCDDQHIIALLGTSRCCLFCSNDSRSYKYIKNRSLYPKRTARVRIYASKKNCKLLKPMSRDMLQNQA